MGFKKDNLITTITVVIIANLTVLVWFEWGSYSSNRDFQLIQERQMEAEKLRGNIIHLDELLTMSVRMAVATGDLKWEERYREFEPKLDATIEKAVTLWPEGYRGEAAAKTDTVHHKLEEMEDRAFNLIRQGYMNEARAILLSDEYKEQKRINAQGMTDFTRSPHLSIRLLELRGIIIHLDEVLTMSARMAAVTGDLKWEERYREFEPKLDAAIKEAIALSPHAYSGESAAKTDTANIKLVEMENRAFDLVRQENSDSAASILFGNEYMQQKRIYSEGMADFNADIAKLAIADMERVASTTSVKTAIVFLLVPFLVFTWFIVFRAVRRWKKTLIQHNNMLSKQTAELAALNKNLDEKVGERVKELNCLYGLSRIIGTPDISLEEIFQQSVRLIPPGWRYPDITCVRLLLEGQEYISDNYQETEWKLSQDLVVAGQVVGSLDVCYLEERPAADEGPFLKEERNLIQGLAQSLQRAIDSKQAEEDRKRLEKNLYQGEKMASIGQLAAGVAHEINNPMGFISSNLNTMNKYLWKLIKHVTGDDSDSPENRERIKEMLEDFGDAISESLEGADRIKKIVADLKSFSRVDAAKVECANLNEGLETTLNIVWNQLKYKCKVEKELGDIPQIECYPNKINQVIMNLLVNAGHAIKGKSGLIRIKTWADDDHVHVSIRDNGCGIPKENLPKLFDAFYTTKEVGKGTGLGLSLAYDIVNKHGGTITVDSEVGKGTEFVVTLPINSMPEPVSTPMV